MLLSIGEKLVSTDTLAYQCDVKEGIQDNQDDDKRKSFRRSAYDAQNPSEDKGQGVVQGLKEAM